MLSFRPIVPGDRPAMEEICATVWEGDDYLPQVFDDWVQDPGGWFTGLVEDGRLLALGRLLRFGPGEYWLEGIRVHGRQRGRGLGAALHDHLTGLWRRQGEAGTLRLATSSENQAIHRLCQRTGFTRIVEFAFSGAPAEAGAPLNFTRVEPESAGRAFEAVSRMPIFQELHGLCDAGWKWRSLTPGLMEARAAAGAVYRWKQWEGVLLAEAQAESDRLVLQFAGARPEQRPAFLADARALAHALGRARVRWCPPARPEVLQELTLAGYEPLHDGEVIYCFEARN